MAMGAKNKGDGRRSVVTHDWGDVLNGWLRRIGAMLLVLALAGGTALWWAARWTPPREQYPFQGAMIDAGNGVVHWGSVKAAGSDFAYIAATDGADRSDAMFARNMRGAIDAGIQFGPLHKFDLCRLATDQAANFIRHVPRRVDALPAAVWLDFDDRCPDRPTRALLLSELATFLAQIEAHMGKPSLIAPSRAFDEDYRVTEAIARTAWLRRDFFAPDYGAHPWSMWQANDYVRISGADGTVGWSVVRPKGELQ